MRSGALRIAVIYVLTALTWVMLSDRILFLFQASLNPRLFEAINSGKGFVFIVVTGYFLFKLIKADEAKLIESVRHSIRADDEVKRLGNIITKVNNIIIITDDDNFICWVNRAFEDFTGYKLEEVAGYAPGTFFVGEETDPDVLTDILNKKKANEAFYAELCCHKKSAEKFWVYGEFTPLFNEQKHFTGYIAVYNDITWLKKKECDVIRQNEKLKEVAWLSSHEVRRPLANIIGLINMMRLAPYMDEKLKIIENINRSAVELDKIVHSINSTIEKEFEQVEQPAK